MAIIKQLKTFLSKTKIYPKTLTKAVYNDDGTSLHEVVKNALYADDDGEVVDADPRDADTLGGKYTADFLDQTFQMAQQFMTSIDIYKLNWGSVTDENIGGVDYKVMWPIAPDGTNDVYGLLITTNGQLGLIRNNKGSKSTSITNYNANTIAGWVTGSSTTQTKTVSYSNYTERVGTVILLNWYNANTYKGLVKMNINSQGAKDLYLNGQITSATNYDIPKGVYVTYFDGTNYYMCTDGKLPIPQIETMESDVNLLKKDMRSDFLDFKGLENGSYVEVPLIIPKSGIYEIFFSIAHCGANNIPQASCPFWSCQVFNENGNSVVFDGNRRAVTIPIGRAWDNVTTGMGITRIVAGTVTVRFTNNSGVKTDSSYLSTVQARARYICD